MNPNYSLQKLPPLQELSFFTTVPCKQSCFFISHRLDPVIFEHLVLAPLCEPKSHHIIAVRMRKNETCIELIFQIFSDIVRYVRIIFNYIWLYLQYHVVSSQKKWNLTQNKCLKKINKILVG